MNLDVGRYRLYSATKLLQERWDKARMGWADTVREEFSREYLDPVEPSVDAVLGAIDRLGQVLARLKQECG